MELRLRSVLSSPAVYSSFNSLLGGRRGRRTFVREYLRPRAGDRILDVGCGPGDLVAFLPECRYVGFDNDRRYIEAAQRRFGARGTFICGEIGRKVVGDATFDLVVASGVLHHLDDGQALDLFRLAWTVLHPGGRMVTIDPCLSPGQPAVTRWLLSRDRGRHMRDRDGYLGLGERIFSRMDVAVRHDLIWPIPYTHIVLEGSSAAS